MTDNTQPEAMDLADWLEAVGGGPSAKRCAALLREQHTRIAELEAQIEALSGVQALSAAPEAFLKSVIALCSHRGYSPANIEAWDKDDKWIADLWRQAESMLAASPTPPAEQQAAQVIIDFSQVGTAGPFPVANGRVSLPDATMQDLARMLRPTYEAEQQAAPKAAPGDAIDEAMRERDDAEDFIDALLDEVLGHERPEWSNLYGRADALNDVQERITSLHKPAVDKAWGQFQSAMAAPQQEAQEPVMIYRGRCTIDCGEHGHHDVELLRLIPKGSKLYTAPQPAPAPLSDDAKDAALWRMVALIGDEVMLPPEKRTQAAAVKAYMDATHSGLDMTGAVGAAMAAQGGKDA